VFAPLSRAGSTDGVSPGDDYNARTTWDEVLTEAGWRKAFSRGEVTHWTRPGKDHGISATTGFGEGDWLYPFTSSTVLEPERTYTRFGFCAAWHYGGDHQAAAKRLQALGYGKAATVVQMPVHRTDSGSLPDAPTARAQPPVTGSVALATSSVMAEPEPLTQAFGLTDVGNAGCWSPSSATGCATSPSGARGCAGPVTAGRSTRPASTWSWPRTP
jgi:putative DNA primase/helicase